MTVFIIYCHINSANGRCYVGQTRCRTSATTPERAIKDRWVLGYDGCPYFYRAILKYGRDAFTTKVLETPKTQAAANLAEAKWIKRLGTLSPDGYNIDTGGGLAPRHPDTRQKMSESQKARYAKLPPEQRKASPETRERISAARREFWASVTPERRAELLAPARKALADMSEERRSEIGKLGIATRLANLPPGGIEEMTRAMHTLTPDQLSQKSKKAHASMSAEQRSERARKINAAQTPEQRRDRQRRAAAAWTPEQHRAAAARAVASQSPEKRSENMRKANASRTPEQRSAIAAKVNASLTPEQHRERMRKAWVTRRANAAKKAKSNTGCE
jgi:hypothetical protein